MGVDAAVALPPVLFLLLLQLLQKQQMLASVYVAVPVGGGRIHPA